MILNYKAYKFVLEARESCQLPEYKGSTLRGAFGHALKRTVCLFRLKDCQQCSIRQECAYAYIFESPPSKDIKLDNFGKYETVPHPFIFEPPEDKKRFYEKGEEIEFGLILVGKAIRYLPYFALAFERLGDIGLGKGKKKIYLVRITTDRDNIYDSHNKNIITGDSERLYIPEDYDFTNTGESEIVLDFRTPVRIKYQRDNVTRLEFFILITNLLRRIMLLNYFYGNENPPDWNHKKIIEESRKVLIKSTSLKWHDWERYSSRQETRMMLGGLKGLIAYEGPVLNFLPLLKAGEILHVGKATSFGLGKYIILASQLTSKGR